MQIYLGEGGLKLLENYTKREILWSILFTYAKE